MIDENGKIKSSPDFLRKNKRLLIKSSEQVFENNSKCPNCGNVVTISEAFTKPCILPNGITVPAFDEGGVMVGKCSTCDKCFSINVTNPEFSEFANGALKKDYYFKRDGKEKEYLYKNLLNTISRVQGDSKLKQYCLNYVYDNYPLYVCKQCSVNLEHLSLEAFKENFSLFQQEHNNYVSWSLKNALGQSPEYIIIKLGFRCSCGEECKVVFFKKYAETNHLDVNEFSICNILGARNIDERIMSGVYSKDTCVSWLYKLIPRWTLLFDKVYIITPFVGHQWLKSDKLMDTWLELVNRLDHKKSKILLKYGQFSSFRKAYSKENNVSYETLSEFDLGADLLSELKQTNDFHAKIYCGISQTRCEVFSGSANLVKGKSMEVMHFNVFDEFSKFNEAFLIPLGINENLNFKTNTHSLLFDSENRFSLFGGSSTISSDEYNKVILQ
jgi:hypothetical protein